MSLPKKNIQQVNEEPASTQTAAKLYDTEKLVEHLQAMIVEAQQHHAQGRLHEAEIAYKQILTILPDNYKILQMRGVLNAQLQRNNVAEELFTKAVAVCPDNSDAHLNLANVLLEQNKQEQALTHYQQAIKLDENNAEAHSGLGALLLNMDRLDEALKHLDYSLLLSPLNADAHSNKANILVRQEQFALAERAYQTAINIDERHVNSYINLSYLYRNQKRFEEAELILREVIRFDPTNVDAHVLLFELYEAMQRHKEAELVKAKVASILPNQAAAYIKLSEIYWQTDQIKKSEQCLRQALQYDPDNVDVLCNLGANLLNAEPEQQYEAQVFLQKALFINPKHIDARINMANLFTNKANYWRAALLLQRVLKQQPDNANALCNLGFVYWEAGQYGRAEELFRECIKYAPEHIDAHTNLGMCLLIQGNYSEGWREYEWRLQRKDFNPPINTENKQRWDKQNISDKCLLIYTEQGLGDTIQLMRLIKKVAKQCSKLICFVPAKLHHLFDGFPDTVQIVSEESEIIDFDYYISLWSLPAKLNLNKPVDFYKENYLQARENKVLQWQDKLSNYKKKRVAIFWQGSRSNRTDGKRSFSLDTLGPLFELDNINIISLQKGDGVEQLDEFEYKNSLIQFDYFDNSPNAFEDTMAILACVDVLVSCDSAIAHVAGAMGVKVYLLLAKAPDFRWEMDVNTSAWYPSVELFRQEKHRDWSVPVLEIKKRLEKTASK